MGKIKKKTILIAVAATAVFIAAVFGARKFVESRVSVGVTVAVEAVKRETITSYVSAKGEVSLVDTEFVYANTMAEVGEVLVEKNDQVKAGDVLIRYTEKSREKIENQLRDAELGLKSAELSLAQAMIPVSQSQIESGRLAVASAEKSISDLRYALEVKERAIEDHKKLISDGEKARENMETLYRVGAASREDLDKAEKAVADLEASLLNMEADLAQSQASMKGLNDNLTYQRQLLEDMENHSYAPETRNAVAQRQIAVEQAQNRVNELKKDLDDFQQEILSPIDGTIISINVSRGAITSTEYALMEISDIDDFIIKVDVNERNASKVELNQPVELKGAVLGKETAAGYVSKIGGVAEQKQTSNGMERVVPVEITLKPSETVKLLKPGFSVDSVITTDVREDVLSVPILATLKDSEGNNYVFVVNSENKLEKRIVELGVYSDMTVECMGVLEGEFIVSQPSLNMTEGMVIIPQNTDLPEEEAAGGENQ